MAENRPVVMVAGAGPGLGQHLLQRFSDGGYYPVALSRSSTIDIDGTHVHLDLARSEESIAEIQKIISIHGAPRVVIHNTAQLKIASFDETSIEDFEQVWRSTLLSAVTLCKAVIDPMIAAGGGAFLVSGATASLRGGAAFSAFSSAKFALRGFTQSIARQYQSAGIHVGHVILDGIIDTPASRSLHSLDPAKMLKPQDIAAAYWSLAHQPESAWSHEVDLRPMSENF